MPAAGSDGSRVADSFDGSAPRAAQIAKELEEARRLWLRDHDERSLRRRLLTVLQQLDETDK